MEIVELSESSREDAKERLQEGKNALVVPSMRPQLLDGRWRAIEMRRRKLKGDRAWFTEKTADIIIAQNVMGDQRDVFYSLRGRYGTKTIIIGKKAYPLKEQKVYDLFTGDIMENVQLLAGSPMQSLGARAGPRGFIFGQDGQAFVPRKNITYNLNGSPVLYFDLADDKTTLTSRARKVIHFEKAAGFERLTSGDISTMLESIFSTSQGQLSEAAHKFLAQREKEGRNIYSVHDADPYGLQMMMLYGLASKNSAYMPTSFYAKRVTPLGLLPSIAQALDLPPEDLAPAALQTAKTNLRDMVVERTDLGEDLDVFLHDQTQWEFQALNAVHELAPQIYLVEALRAKGDDIKYVPSANEVKETLLTMIRASVEEFVDKQIADYAFSWLYNKTLPEVVKKLKVALASDIEVFISLMEKELPKLDELDEGDLREAVKLKLVENPKQYADEALKQVVDDILSQTFSVDTKIQVRVSIDKAKAETSLSITDPELPESPLTKDDISVSIEKEIIPDDESRDEVVKRIRGAIETRFGEPDLTW